MRPVAMPPHADQARWFSEHVLPHEADLRAYLRGRFPAHSDLDDLVQETYARVFRARRAGAAAEARPYLFATARHAALDYFRRRALVPFESLDENPGLAVAEDRPDAAETAARRQEIALLHEAVAALPERCRQVLVLRRFEGRSHAEIARALGIAEKTVDAHLCLGIFRCREFLVAHGVSPDVLVQAGRRAGVGKGGAS